MKICKNCFWFFSHPDKLSAQCMYQKEYTTDIVHGIIKWSNYGGYTTCEKSRKNDLMLCGYNARYFKEKK